MATKSRNSDAGNLDVPKRSHQVLRMQMEKPHIQGSVLPVVSHIHWGSWNLSPTEKGVLLLLYFPKWNEITISKRCNPNLVSTDTCMNEENTIHIHKRTLLDQTKGGNPAVCDNTDGPRGRTEGIMLNEISQTKTNTVWPHLYVEPKKPQTQIQR